jgi:hypothetical protein
MRRSLGSNEILYLDLLIIASDLRPNPEEGASGSVFPMTGRRGIASTKLRIANSYWFPSLLLWARLVILNAHHQNHPSPLPRECSPLGACKSALGTVQYGRHRYLGPTASRTRGSVRWPPNFENFTMKCPL